MHCHDISRHVVIEMVDMHREGKTISPGLIHSSPGHNGRVISVLQACTQAGLAHATLAHGWYAIQKAKCSQFPLGAMCNTSISSTS